LSLLDDGLTWAIVLLLTISRTLNPFSLFWNDLLETHLSEDSTAPLTLSVDDLLQAPRARATIFAVNTDYLGRTFASQRVSPP
jgi:hypothetical protein